MTSQLRLNHMTIYRGGYSLYSEQFHDGLNIIHGDNGSGKSTLMDFIFFGLGGDLRDWKEQAELVEFVLVEVLAGKTLLTLRRDVSTEAGRPMGIFFGALQDALKAGPTQWRICPYRRQDDNYSFSQILFRAIGLPEAVSDGASNITMHQILRLLYSDQMTPVQRIFRVENFDTWQTRQAVGDLMCGIGGYDLYERQIRLRSLKREFEEVERRLRSLLLVAGSFGDNILPEHIRSAIDKDEQERTKLQESLRAILIDGDGEETDHEEAEKVQKAQGRRVARARRSVAEIDDRIATLEYEIEDAQLFIEHLEKTLKEFDDAASTFYALGQMKFEFCPACFKPVADSGDDTHCHLCGSDMSVSPGDSKALAVRLDLEMQLKESLELQKQREATLAQLKVQRRTEQAELRAASEAFELARRGQATDREKRVAELSRRGGYLDSEIAVLLNRLSIAEDIGRVTAEKEALNAAIGKLDAEIEAITVYQAKRKQVAYTAVSSHTRQILDQDLTEQNDFGDVTHVSFDFGQDWIAINNDKNRSRSASGMVVLKNSFHFGIYLAALDDPNFGLPRFMLFDNIEDKGMVQERSWNFQRVMLSECKKRNGLQQVIISTSKITPELAGTPIVVGRKYTRENPSLEFARPSGGTQADPGETAKKSEGG